MVINKPTQLCLSSNLAPAIHITPLSGTDETAVSLGKALPINVDWQWLADEINGELVRVLVHRLPHGRPEPELVSVCTGYHVASDHFLFVFESGQALRSHGYGWIRCFQVIGGNVNGRCHTCGNTGTCTELSKLAYDVMSDEWKFDRFMICKSYCR